MVISMNSYPVRLFELSDLTRDMMRCHRTIEHFTVRYAKITFDVIYDVGQAPFEMIIGAYTYNWSSRLKIQPGYLTVMKNTDYYALLKILHLTYKGDGFSSIMFLKYIAAHSPHKCSAVRPSPALLSRYRKVDEQNKIYFAGWVLHITDGKMAKNFDKTEKLLGKDVADYCRAHNISSKWTDIPEDEVSFYPPNANKHLH